MPEQTEEIKNNELEAQTTSASDAKQAEVAEADKVAEETKSEAAGVAAE